VRCTGGSQRRKSEHGVADQVDGGLEPGQQQQQAERIQLRRRQLVAFRGQQLTHDVVAGLMATVLEHLGQQPSELPVSLDQAGHVRDGLRSGEGAADRGAVAGEGSAVGVRNPEEVGDDRDRQGRGQAGDQVPGTVGRDPVQEVVDHLLDPRAVPGDGVRSEGGRDEPAQPRVVRWVELEQRQRAVTAAESTTLDAYAEPSVPEHLATHLVRGGLVADQWAGDELATPPDLLIEGVGIAMALGGVEPGQRVPADMRMPSDLRPHDDELTCQGHDGVHEPSHIGAPPGHASLASMLRRGQAGLS
jgi:hypothetical protein